MNNDSKEMQAFVKRTMAKAARNVKNKPDLSKRDQCIANNLPSLILYALSIVLEKTEVSLDMLTDENAQEVHDWILNNIEEED